MKVRALTLLMLHLNALVDSGKYTEITVKDIHKAIEGKRVLRFLEERAGQDIDLSVHLQSDVYGDFAAYYEQKLSDIYGGYAGQEFRKWGIENLGLCLVLAWTLEIIQRGENLEW